MRTNPAIVWGTRTISWDRLEIYSMSVVRQLKGLGIKPRDRVAMCAPTSPEYLIVLFSLWRLKAVACPVSPRWPSKAVNEYVSLIKSPLLLTTAAIKVTLASLPVRTLLLNELVSFNPGQNLELNIAWQPDAQQEATVLATSGSSGQPKAAVHTWENHSSNAVAAAEIIPLSASDSWLLSLPLYHVAGIAIVVRCFLAGAAIVIASDDDLIDTIQERQPTHVSLVATQLLRLINSPQAEILKSLKCILLGGGPVPAGLIEKSRALGLKVYVSYGLTEMSSQVATGKGGECIKPFKQTQVKIDDDNEILVKGPTLFKGYIQAGRVHLPLTPDGWFKTGDVGALKDGCLSVTGRKDNMFISGGENIHPEEIEKVILTLEGVSQVVVIPKEDAEFGARPVAFIQYAARTTLTPEHITAHCQNFLPKFKIPVAFYAWPQELKDGYKVSRHNVAKLL